MYRYFFDIVREHQSQYDHRGHGLPNTERAFEMTELMALDLRIDSEGTWQGWAVQVRNAFG